MRNVRFIAFTFGCTLATGAFGQTAGMLSFQGLIRDAQGDPVEGSVTLEFRIFDAEVGGNLVDMDGDGVVEDVIGEDAKQVVGVSVTGGVVSTKFGPVSPKAFDGNERWLQVSVDGEALSRVELANAPAIAEQLNAPGSGTPAATTDN
ncbi:MAG: hypothetical protein IID36_07505, partial [Planctomycetes bacterium]|nr:hypothetical protein [Planctomycetota bacterium]